MDERALCIENYAESYADNEIDFAFERNNKNEEIKKFSYENLKEVVNLFCVFSFKIFYVSYGILQFFVIWNSLLKVFHHNNLIISSVSLILAFIPFVGTGFGIWGAHISWGWSLLHSIIVFIIPYFFVNIPLLMITFFESYKDFKRWNVEKTIFNDPHVDF